MVANRVYLNFVHNQCQTSCDAFGGPGPWGLIRGGGGGLGNRLQGPPSPGLQITVRLAQRHSP